MNIILFIILLIISFVAGGVLGAFATVVAIASGMDKEKRD